MVCVNYIMKHLYLLIAASFFFCAADAQKNCTVLKSKACYTISQPGNIRVDETGRQVNPGISKERFIYITTSCNVKPKITLLKYGKITVAAEIEKVTGSSIVLAKNSDGEDIYFRATKGTTIWKINIQENQLMDADAKPDIYLKVLINKKTQIIRIYSETLLLSPDRP
jgi:hypothetical protein